MEKSLPAKMGRLRHRCCTLPFLFKLCVLLLSVCSILLLLQSIFGSKLELNPDAKSGKVSGKVISSLFIERELLPKQYHASYSSDCKVPRLNNSTIPPDVVCKRMRPQPGSCQLAHDLYTARRAETCSHQTTYQLCQIKGEGKNMAVGCNREACPGPVSLGTINPAIGVLHWEELSDMAELQAHLKHLLLTSKPEVAFGFCFIKCPLDLKDVEGGQGGEDDDGDDYTGNMRGKEDGAGFENSFQAFDKDYLAEETDNERWAQQLLLFPISRHGVRQAPDKPQDLNINVILLDSVSHSHFYRSLPRTVRALRDISEEKTASVYNFNLMQSLKSRTYENLQMLFSGEMYNPEKPFGVQDMPPNPLRTEVILEGFKHRGYETMWMEDLCWTWEWGIAKNFVVHSPTEMLSFRWQKLKSSMNKAGVDHLGLAPANCEILRANDHNDPFHGPPALCYNGEYQHAYMLQYAKELHRAKQLQGVPFFHYIELNVAHDDLGVRVQGLDAYLEDFVKFTASQKNTMTVILADHGNAYGSFLEKSEEGRVEMFHPAFFMLLSKNADEHLTMSQRDALYVNQDRLVSIMDVHYMLRYLAYPGLEAKVAPSHQQFDASPLGLLKEVSPNRTCDHIPRIQPNVCICEDYDARVANDTTRNIFAEFALGELNNAIQSQFVEVHPDAKTGFGRCQPLQALWFANVRENFHGTNAIIKLDLHVKAGKNASQSPEIFFVTLMVSSKPGQEELQLLSYERLTPYSQYSACTDKGVATKLCVCSLSTSENRGKAINMYNSVPRWHKIPSFFSPGVSTVKEVTGCLVLYERRTMNGVILEASSECRDRLYLVEVNAKTENIITSRALPAKEILKPGMRTFVIVFVQNVQKRTWNLEYSLLYTEHKCNDIFCSF